jgi:hypothetical protein
LPFNEFADDSHATKLEIAKETIANAQTLGVRTTVTPADLMSSAASVKIAFAAQIFSCKHGLPSVSGDVEAAARALADPPGMHKRKLTDAEKAEQDTKEAEQREHLQSIIRKALSFSDDAARLAKEAEANAERAQSAATSGNADSLVIRDVLAEDHALTATVMKLAQEGDAFAASAGSHFEACAAAAEAIRTKYEQATVCMTASDAEACLASCEIEFNKASKEATATSDDRLSADDVARRIALARAEARLRVAQSLCDRSRDRTQGYVATAQALDQTVDAVRSATSECENAGAQCEQHSSQLQSIAELVLSGKLDGPLAADTSATQAEELLQKMQEAEASAKERSEAAQFASEIARFRAEASGRCRDALEKSIASAGRAHVHHERARGFDQNVAAVKSAIAECATACEVCDGEVAKIRSLLASCVELKQQTDLDQAVKSAYEARIKCENAENLARQCADAAAEAHNNESARLQAEAAERDRLRAEAEEKERTRLQAEAEEKTRLQAEAEEKTRLQAEADERERARLQAEAEDKARLRAEAEERARLQAEEKERAGLQAAADEKARLQAQTAAEEATQARADENLNRPLLSSDNAQARSWWQRCCFCCYYR